MPDEIEDTQLEERNIRKAKYNKQEQDKKDRLPVNIVTPVEGIHADERIYSKMREDDKFQEKWLLY